MYTTKHEFPIEVIVCKRMGQPVIQGARSQHGILTPELDRLRLWKMSNGAPSAGARGHMPPSRRQCKYTKYQHIVYCLVIRGFICRFLNSWSWFVNLCLKNNFIRIISIHLRKWTKSMWIFERIFERLWLRGGVYNYSGVYSCCDGDVWTRNANGQSVVVVLVYKS